MTGSNNCAGPTTISGGTLLFSGAANQTLSGGISGGGALVATGPGTLTVSGTGSYGGGTLIQAGARVILGSALTINSQNQTINQSVLGSGAVTLSGGTLTLPANSGPVAGLACMKLDPYLTPAYGNNVYGNSDNPNFAFKPNMPSGIYPLMGDCGNRWVVAAVADNPPNANLYASRENANDWGNYTGYVYSGTINIPAVSNHSGADYISFLQAAGTGGGNEALYIDGHQVFDASSGVSYTTYSQATTPWLSSGPHSFYYVTYNSTSSSPGGYNFYGEGFAWDLNGDYTTNGTLDPNNPPNGTSYNGLHTQAGFSMPVDPGNGSLFTSQPVNTSGSPLKITSDSVLDVTTSGATTIFTSTLSIGDCKLSVVGGQSAPGSVQINGAVSLTGVAQTTFDVQNNNTLTLYGSISGSNGAGLIKIGSGALVLGNANTYSGATTVNAGTLMLNYSNTLNLTINGGAVATAHGATTTILNPFALTGLSLTSTGGGNSTGAFDCNYAIAGPLNATSNANGNPATINGAVGLQSGNVVFNVARGSQSPPVDLNVTGAIGSNLSGASLTIQGNGITALAGANVAGTLNVGAGAAVIMNANHSLNDCYYLNSPAIQSAASTSTPPSYFNSLSTFQAHLAAMTPSFSGQSNSQGQSAFTMDPNGIEASGFPTAVQANPNDFEAIYTGEINITTAGVYTFGTNSDDGSMIWIDGNNTPVVSNNSFKGEGGGPQQTGTVTLTAGEHQIAIGFYQGGGPYGLQAYYNGPDTSNTMELIPNSVLTAPYSVGSLQGSGNVQWRPASSSAPTTPTKPSAARSPASAA